MHSVVSRSLKVFTTTLAAALLALSTPALAAAAPQQGQCANRQAPPPPVDTSEKPAPGKQAPPPLAVPAVPAGGDRMAECGLITPDGALNPPDGNTAASWLVQDLDTGAVIAAKDPHARQRPASLIKTLLALVVVTQLDPLQPIVATKEDAEQECTCVGLVAGGQYTVDQLLHGLLMHSGNDVAHAFATALGGVDATVAKMNALAAKIGALDTRAATPSGLDGPGMSTSAYDLSLIFHYAMKQPEFAKVVATKNFVFPPAGGKPAIPIYNDNKLLGVYPGFLGGKTGFTDDARHTYVGAAQRKGKRLAVVMLRAEQKPTKVVDQAAKLLDYGFALEADRAVPVGRITYQAPAATPADSSVLAEGDTGNSGTSSAASAAKEDPFGVTGWIITLVVFLIIVGGFVVGHQRKKAAG
ncbi:D-alanyl-D-alanine carboxypeptidase family protein [Amycolatopsis tolypomycina]|uniref:D-alanyl-D-alanine carboxypeptidase (Penicillin-binding protein 5/6) n=1 Tax=Amycolatopsis tolypomycina TaxID=208445 RepID=A0A1H4IJK7_9PSEU|nr:D-alanyl-D-alanine carboxypeptidase family protein [Amycolatopsis tolypomycina]SEB34103.1 D-alanyl-D-alanine carboxypeptidase (penicillin-binding protein 5/6) [Amycolatopsis tolypomycina]